MICVAQTEPSRRGWARALALALLMGVAPGAYAEKLLLSEALLRASDNDPAYAAAMAVQRAEREIGVQERSALRPTVGINGGGQFIASDSEFAFGSAQEEYPAWSATLEVRQPLLRLDWSARRGRADARDALADAQFRQSQIDFIARVVQRYLDAMRTHDQLVSTQAEVAAVEKSLGDVRKRYEVELVPGTDLKEAQARFDLARAQLLRAEAAREQAYDALAELTGSFEPPLPRLKTQLTLPQPPVNTLDGWMNLMGESSATLEMAALRLRIAEADRRSRKADAQPRADIVASAGRIDSTQSELGSRQDEARIGVEFSVPIYAGGLNSSLLREAEARIDEARHAQERIVRESEREIRTQFREFDVARISADALSVALESSRAAETAVMAGYDAGTRTIADVLDAKQRVAQAERDYNEARYELLTRLLMLQAAAGSLTVEAVLALDSLLDLS